MPIIDKILKCEKLKKDNVYSEKTCSFNNLTARKVGELAKHLINKITQEIKVNEITGYKNAGEYSKNEKLFKHPKEVKSDEEKTNCTILPKNSRSEDILERMIKISSLDCNNQVPIPDLNNGSHIDLAIKKDKTINIIELKRWDNTKNNPCYTIAENIKNLYMLLNLAYHYDSNNKYEYQNKITSVVSDDRKFYEINDVKKFILTVLAPKEYYESHFKNDKNLINKYKEFCSELEKCIQEDLRDKLHKKDLEIRIEIKQLSLTQKEYEKIIKELKEKTSENIHKKAGKFKRNKKGNISIDLKDYKNSFDEYKKELIEWSNVI